MAWKICTTYVVSIGPVLYSVISRLAAI